MRAAIGKIPGTEQASAEYAKKPSAKASVGEAQAIAELASAGPLMVARFAVLCSAVAVIVAIVALITTLNHR